jgi:uncharacterized protein YdeI (BOF family)
MRFAGVILLGTLFTVGCNQRSSVILGQPPTGQTRTVASIRAATPTEHVTLTGSMIEKCPVAGCWFRLRDETGVIKVDTRAAGFVVADVPVKSILVVSGKVVADGDSFSIEATGVRY